MAMSVRGTVCSKVVTGRYLLAYWEVARSGKVQVAERSSPSLRLRHGIQCVFRLRGQARSPMALASRSCKSCAHYYFSF